MAESLRGGGEGEASESDNSRYKSTRNLPEIYPKSTRNQARLGQKQAAAMWHTTPSTSPTELSTR
eukprot:2049527-Rhodomonas_salina.1